MSDLRNLSLDFLICCYFGQSKDLVRVAIDRAYVDMASHTMTSFKEDKKLKEISDFIMQTDVSEYSIPIDSYVMKEEGLDKSFGPWSRLDEKQYEKLQKNLKNDFMWELTNWESFKEKYKEIDGESYEVYYKK